MGDQSKLRARCKEFYQQQGRNAMLRQGDPVEDLMAFVIAESGRTADASLEETLPVCLYFATKDDREELIAAVQQAKPNMIARRLP